MMNVFLVVYNFCKIHGTLKTSPAVAAAITDRVWSIRELLEKLIRRANPNAEWAT